MAGIGPAAAAIASGIGTFLTSTSTFFVVARLVTAVAATALLSKRLAGFDPGIQGRAVTVRGTVEPQILIYGEALVSGLVFWNEVYGEQGRYLTGAIALAGHEVNTITDVWLDDEIILEADINGGNPAGGPVTGGFFAPRDGKNVVEIGKHYGTATQAADPLLLAAFPAWTSAHRARGVAYLTFQFNLWNRSEGLWDNKEPTNIRARVLGKSVYDPRADSSPGANPDDPAFIAASSNPALCIADYLRDSKFGLGIPASRIDWGSIVTVADYCDVSVSIPGGSEPRFTCNGTLAASATYRDNLASLLSSCNGEITVSAGFWTLRAGYQAPDVDLTADDIISPLGIKRTLERSERANQITGQFIDSEDNYAVMETPVVDAGGAFLTRDNGVELLQEIELPFTHRYYMAQRVCWQQLQLADLERQVSATFNLRAAQQAVGGRINLTLDELDWQPEIFRVQQWELRETGDTDNGIGVQCELRVDSASAYADPLVGDYTVRNANGTFTPADPAVDPATSLNAVPSDTGGILWSWANPDEFDDFDEIVLYTSPDSNWSNASEVWRGRADSVLIVSEPLEERFGWVRVSRSGELSLRNPNSDTSTVSAVAPEYSFPNLVPVGYSAFDNILSSDITFGAASANPGAVSIGSTLPAAVGVQNLRWEALSDFRMTGADAVALSKDGDLNIAYNAGDATEMQVVAFINPQNLVSGLYEVRWILQGASSSASSDWAVLEDLGDIVVGSYGQVSFAIDVSAFTETRFRLTLEITNQNAAPSSGYQNADITFDGIMLIDTTYYNVPPDVAAP